MVTNEEILLNCAEDAIRAFESSCSLEEFDGSIDPQDAWKLSTPFDPVAAGIAPGMIARVVRSGFSQGPMRTYVIESVVATGLFLRNPGHAPGVGRGPGVEFGLDPVKAKIVDTSPILREAQKTVDARFGSFRPDDPVVEVMKSEAVRHIAIARAADAAEFRKAFTGTAELSVDRYESRILEKLGSDLLMHLTRTKDGAQFWPRVQR